MDILQLPENFINTKNTIPDLFVFDYIMTTDIVNRKANVNLNLFSFLQTGQKKINFADTSITINENQSVLIKPGNCLFTELLLEEQTYFCKLFFFSQNSLESFFLKHKNSFNFSIKKNHSEIPFFIIENDNYIKSFIQSLSTIMTIESEFSQELFMVKFEEILLYLIFKYEQSFIDYLHSLITHENKTSFKTVIENNVISNLKIEEIAFLCNRSLSTFKRHFITEFQETPGRWIQRKRLLYAKEQLEHKKCKPSDIYIDIGYTNYSNFSTAFKNEFGINPKEIQK
jgi:AraC-like DNA-binding protein